LGNRLLWAVTLKVAKVNQILGYFFPRQKLRINVGKKELGCTVCEFFSEAHPVTLMATDAKNDLRKEMTGRGSHLALMQSLRCEQGDQMSF
jgi:hypothetical protein